MLTICRACRKKSFSIIRQNRIKILFISLIFTLSLFLAQSSFASSLNGRILLQVEENGEAWYVNPVDSSRYYMGRPDDAFSLMRSLGLGASDADIGSYQLSKAPSRLSGRILLQVQDKGQAFYVNPTDLKLYYLGRPADAFYVMRSLGLGISNENLLKIQMSPHSATPKTVVVDNHLITYAYQDGTRDFNFKYDNREHSYQLRTSSALYKLYSESDKTVGHTPNASQSELREKYYNSFFKFKTGDATIPKLVYDVRVIASINNWSEDQALEYALAIVQYIPYDYSKIHNSYNSNPYFPYETLYLNKGVCSDKTFLALAIVEEFGYGGAILDFPSLNHSALGLQCPIEYSVRNSGYCFVETTNYFPMAVIPQNINNGLAEDSSLDFSQILNDSNLGSMEIYRESVGKIYYGIYKTMEEANSIKDLQDILPIKLKEIQEQEAIIESREARMNAMIDEIQGYFEKGEIELYNKMAIDYNQEANEFNLFVEGYRAKVEAYNQLAKDLNSKVANFYQK